MAAIIREVLTATNTGVTLSCAGMSKVGFNLSGTWTGTVKFFWSVDGVNFHAQPAGAALSVFPFPPSGTVAQTSVQSATANGSWEADVQNYAAVRAEFTRTSGSVAVTIGTSLDASYQDAFLAATSTYVNQTGTAGAAVVVTQAAQANRAWRLRTCTVGFSVAPGGAVKVTVSDGGSATLWEEYTTAAAGTYQLKLPSDPPIQGTASGGVVGSLGNSMVVTVAAPGGSVATDLNCEFWPG